jgi:pimeloyl-ACP methyl ester carboxylesterase
MTRLVRILLILLLFPALLSMVAGWMGAPGFLHPEKRAFTADMVRDADVTFAQIGARREDFDVRTPDGVTLRGWKVRTAKPNGAWVLIYRGERLAGFPASEVSPEKAVKARAFPLLLICDGADVVLPCRHSEAILRAAAGSKEFWRVPGALHTGAMGTAPGEYQRRVISFFDSQRNRAEVSSTKSQK